MARVPSLLNTPASSQPFGEQSALGELDLDVFLKLLLTELQNQDPLNPLDNSEMLAQINQIREIGATDKLTGTLNSVLLGQNIASATNLIGSDVDAVSDDGQPVHGTVSKVSIEGGEPKLQLDLETAAKPSIEEGNLDVGKYGYRIVWKGENGGLRGIEFSGDDAISTEPVAGNDYSSVVISNLPDTPGPKRIYRTDSTGESDYQLLTILNNGSQSEFRDTIADEDRSETRQTEDFDKAPGLRLRSFNVSLSNVSEIRAPQP